jgi:hypothetical protein
VPTKYKALISYEAAREVSEIQIRSLNSFQQEVLEAFQGGNFDPHRHQEFASLNLAEILNRFEQYRQEAEYHGILTILARAEADLKDDFNKRKLQQTPFNSFYLRFGDRFRLDELLDLWKVADPSSAPVIGDFKGARHLRHWLAHGRNYDANIGKSYTVLDVFSIAHILRASIVAFPLSIQKLGFRQTVNLLLLRFRIRIYRRI